MRTKQFLWESDNGWDNYSEDTTIAPQLVIFFGSTSKLSEKARYSEIIEMFPDAALVGCTTAGEIIGDEVMDESIVLTAIEFENTDIQTATLILDKMKGSFQAGQKLGEELDKKDLQGVFVISDGQRVNGSELVNGLADALGENIIITGGLAGDGGRFEKTLVSCNSAPESGRIAVVGFYGKSVQIGHGSIGGWDTFGPERKITKASANVLYELDGKPALELYKQYLGEEAENLPGSALLFPLMIKPHGQEGTGTVRTVLSVDEEAQSMTFAGDIPAGYSAQLMMANFDRLVEGAAEAAKYALDREWEELKSESLAILISCVGRKMVLGQRVGDEVESVMEIFGGNMTQIGFYSYGEISPHVEVGNCQLHNQTMTITSISERL